MTKERERQTVFRTEKEIEGKTTNMSKSAKMNVQTEKGSPSLTVTRTVKGQMASSAEMRTMGKRKKQKAMRSRRIPIWWVLLAWIICTRVWHHLQRVCASHCLA